MNIKLILGVLLFVVGLIAAIGGIVSVGQPGTAGDTGTVSQESRAQNGSEGSGWAVLPWVGGLSLAIGGVLIGLSMGNFKNPRSAHKPGDEVVNPEGYQKMKHV